jgi:DNA-binding transcriptional MerR regulator
MKTFQTVLTKNQVREIRDSGLTLEEARNFCHDWNVQLTEEEREFGEMMEMEPA